MSQTKSVRISDDLAERIQEATEEGEHESATLRRLIRAGLDAEDGEDSRTVTVTPAGLLMALGVLLIGASPEVATITPPAGVSAFWLGLLLVVGAPLAKQRGWVGGGTRLFTTEPDATTEERPEQ